VPKKIFKDKHSSLFCWSVNDDEKVLTRQSVTHFFEGSFAQKRLIKLFSASMTLLQKARAFEPEQF
jgi:hypothetical protein